MRTKNNETWKVDAERIAQKSPRHLLFLCVANSSRSQIAEGIARHLAPPEITITSAGSSPTEVSPYAIEVLSEIGIDITTHTSKSVSSIQTHDVDTVITLCAEEVCPVFLGQAMRIHWGLPDPAAETGDPKSKLAAFRKVREELFLRLSFLFELIP